MAFRVPESNEEGYSYESTGDTLQVNDWRRGVLRHFRVRNYALQEEARNEGKLARSLVDMICCDINWSVELPDPDYRRTMT